MQALAALTVLAAHAGAVRFSAQYRANPLPQPPYTLGDAVDDLATLTLRRLDGDAARWPPRVVKCARQLGLSRCVKAFAVCRSERAAAARAVEFDLRDELERQFPWERFSNASEEEMDSLVLDSAARLVRERALTLTYPGLVLDVSSQRNGSLHVDVKKDTTDAGEMTTGRGRGKRWRRTFYRIVPFLLIPPLILAAILPFKLPAFMMLTMAAVMINNMAFTGSLFTLLRNNAFDDNYEKKVIYVNEGYKNEEPHPAFPEDSFPEGFQGAFSEPGIQTESVQGETFFPSDIKVKKRRGHKRKRKPVPAQEEGFPPDGGFSLEGIPNAVGGGRFPLEGIPNELGGGGFPLEGIPNGVGGGGEPFGDLYHESSASDQQPDYTNFRNSFNPELTK